MKDANNINRNYTYLQYLGNREHLLLNNDNNVREVFVANKNHAGWCLVYKNTHLEFCRDYSKKQAIEKIKNSGIEQKLILN